LLLERRRDTIATWLNIHKILVSPAGGWINVTNPYDPSAEVATERIVIDIEQLPWWRQLDRYQWFVFVVASLAWLFDCLDQQLFLIARNDAITSLMPPGTDSTDIKSYGAYATSIFVLGWATGGLIFGSVGDRIGRAKTLTITVLMYSVCTGLSALSRGWIDFAFFRFVTGMGVGGVFGLSVALVADTVPASARTAALGTLQALSAVGNVTAALIGMAIGKLVSAGTLSSGTSWKAIFLIGSVPALLCVFIQMRLKEPEKWVAARQAGRATGVKFGSYASMLGDSRWRKNSLFGMMLCVAGVIGLWGIGFFSPELVGDVIGNSLRDSGVSDGEIEGAKKFWISTNMIVQNIGAFAGMLFFTWLTQRVGRKPAFVFGYVAAMISTIVYFQTFGGIGDIWKSAIMGFFQLGLFALFAIYLPELFPTRLRSTGTSFCYNVGRFVAASGPLTLGYLQRVLVPTGAVAQQKIDALRDAASYMSVIFLVGIIAILFLPETKGRPLPEDVSVE
jgi:MFS family permease